MMAQSLWAVACSSWKKTRLLLCFVIGFPDGSCRAKLLKVFSCLKNQMGSLWYVNNSFH